VKRNWPAIVEIAVIVGLFCAGVLLRVQRLEYETVEHFDEGIYSSVLWYDALFEAKWPGRDFFAPAGLPFLIELGALIPGAARLAPFFPALAFGALTPLLFWWVARAWFGRCAGVFVLAILAGCEFHIIYSRMALTDVPALSLVVASVGLGSLAMQRNSARLAIVSGVICGLAWWIKYTGWLPLAILGSGGLAWWIVEGRKWLSGLYFLRQYGLTAMAAVVTFSPCWWSLRAVGGYSAVASNHAGYLTDWQQWNDRMADQLAYQMQMDGICGAGSLSVGFALAALIAGIGMRRFTWNAGMTGNEQSVYEAAGFAVRSLWLRAFPAAVFLGLLSLRVHTPVMLACVSIGGLTGMFLWPVLRSSTQEEQRGIRMRGFGLRSVLLPSAGEVSGLGFWLTAAWCAGLLAVTPLYQPFSRLLFPLAGGVWLAAAGGVGWWFECQLILFSRPKAGMRRTHFAERFGRYLVVGLLIVALGTSMFSGDGDGGLTLVSLDEFSGHSLYYDRRDISRAARELVDRCSARVRGEAAVSNSLGFDRVFTPDMVQRQNSATEDLPRELSTDERRSFKAVFCVYGEPALLWHLHCAGLSAVPVSHVNPEARGDGTPVFLIFGPNAKRTPGFWEAWRLTESNFDWLGDVVYRPGVVTLMDLFSPDYLSKHSEAQWQRLEVYQVRVRRSETSGDRL
jgi:hypothetical protein